MAETVKLPGIGPVNKTWVWAGGALVVGVVGFAYFRNAQSPPPAAEPEQAAEDTGAVDYSQYYDAAYTGDYSYSGSQPSYVSPYPSGVPVYDTTPTPTTNPEWVAAALEFMESAGTERNTASLAISKYIAKLCVTTAQADIIRQALAGVGPVPQGQPYSVTICPPSGGGTGGDGTPGFTLPGGPIGPVTGLKATPFRYHVDLDWDPLPNVDGYTIWANGIRKTSNYFSTEHVWNLKPNTTHRLEVAGFRNENGQYIYGPRTAVTVKTLKA